MTILGTSGDDNLTGTSGDDIFDLRQGGHDTASGLGGDDHFIMRGTLSAGDHLDGGDGTDTVVVDGLYHQGLVIDSSLFTGIENLIIKGDHAYSLTLDGAAAAGQSLTINTTELPVIPSGITFEVDATAATAGSYHFILGAGQSQIVMGDQFKVTDHISDLTGRLDLELSGNYTMRFSARTIVDIGGMAMDHSHNYHFIENDANVTAGFEMFVSGDADASHSDYFNGSAETDGTFFFSSAQGQATYQGGAGDDTFSNYLIASDRFYGNGGDDTIDWDAGMTGAASLHTQLHGVEDIILFSIDSSHILTVVTGGHIADPGKDLTVDATNFHTGIVVNFDDAADHGGALIFINGEDRGVVIGTSHSDTFDFTNAGNGTITGGAGADTIETNSAQSYTFVYFAAADSTGPVYDTIAAANFTNDTFRTHAAGAATTGVDSALTSGTLSKATFDTDLAAAVGAGQMAAHHAVLFTASAGTLSGHTFLVIDENGTAGYQASADLVIDVTGAAGTLSTLNFS